MRYRIRVPLRSGSTCMSLAPSRTALTPAPKRLADCVVQGHRSQQQWQIDRVPEGVEEERGGQQPGQSRTLVVPAIEHAKHDQHDRQDEDLEAELARREAEDIRTKGAALIAMLFKGLLDRGVEVGGAGGRLVYEPFAHEALLASTPA